MHVAVELEAQPLLLIARLPSGSTLDHRKTLISSSFCDRPAQKDKSDAALPDGQLADLRLVAFQLERAAWLEVIRCAHGRRRVTVALTMTMQTFDVDLQRCAD